jgi:hypothetical protein
MKTKKLHNEENREMLVVLKEVGTKERDKLMAVMAESYAAETLTAANVLDQDLEEEEIRARYLNILEGLSFGRLIGTVAASTPNAGETILKLTEGSDLYDVFKEILDAWSKEPMDMEELLRFFKATIQGMVADGIAEESSVDPAFLN